MNYQIPLEKIKVSIENEFLLNGIEKISEHIFTKPLQREDGTPLDPIKAKYQISFTSVCELSEDSFVAIFLTTQQLPDELSLIPQVHAAGGWLGDSHMAIIESSNLEIYERFPFEAELVELPTIEEEPVLHRFGAYYNCREIVGITKDRILIDCHNNIYSFNRQTTTFKELSICGSYFNANSYRTERFTCFGQSGEIYFDKEESIE